MRVAMLYCGSVYTKGCFDKLLKFPRVEPVMLPSNASWNLLCDLQPAAIIIGGSGDYVNAIGAPRVDPRVFAGELAPVLGICYGMQLMAAQMGGRVGKMKLPEQKWHNVKLSEYGATSPLFSDFIEGEVAAWMAHNCMVYEVPEGFEVTGSTKHTPVASFENRALGLYGVQWHPDHAGRDPSSQAGTIVLTNFLREICGYNPVENV